MIPWTMLRLFWGVAETGISPSLSQRRWGLGDNKLQLYTQFQTTTGTCTTGPGWNSLTKKFEELNCESEVHDFCDESDSEADTPTAVVDNCKTDLSTETSDSDEENTIVHGKNGDCCYTAVPNSSKSASC
ncbi:uncharacterized protein LOC126175361 isoform X1 [Schistocerca cancellata]|uniref:uncharacterized protein LOC126175361 isoform X1 n=1 Tax=Schistocerca cancellata TaxID=274614 RepID=UPI0021193239|nr:uncharacterized protein LOC126175361 isoform X1 [Schistocerca cancellata]